MNTLLRHPAALAAVPVTRLAVLLTFLAAPCVAQDVTLELVGEVAFPATSSGNGTSDVWGYTAPDGSEYAVVGVLDGTAIVSVPGLEVLHTIPGPTQNDFFYHRDMVVHGHYAYVVSECTGTNQGLQVIDLSGLPASAPLVNVHTDGVVSSHNMDVDGGTGYLYVLDPNYGGVEIIDASDPLNLENVHYLDLPSVHDVHARNDTLYVAEVFDGTFSIWDVSNKTSPQLLARVSVPNSGFVHNIWPSDDGRLVVTTEETVGKTVKVWDVSDMDDIELVGEYLGANDLAHNAHVMGDLIVLSHYRAGVTVVDISDPTDPVEVARYDTTPGSDGSGFFGTWGAFPYTAGGYVYASDFDGRLTVLRMGGVATATEQTAPLSAARAEAYPNPFREGATVRFEIAEGGPVRAVLYDVLGREMGTLAAGVYGKGVHTLEVEGRALLPGAYFLRLEAGGVAQTLRIARVQ